MIPVTKTNNCSTSGLIDTVNFGIKQENLATVFHILRSQLYSDKILAVIREYSSNAYDSHIAAACSTRPIRITLPTQMNPYFKIRDFGVGLSHQDVQDVYAFYGCSTKRNSNDFVGQLGLGSKSGFAYGDNFVINSFLNGQKNSYNAFIDDTQVGQIALISSEETTEENGVEIIIPVKSGQERYFIDKATEFFRWFPVMPEFIGIQPTITIPKAVFEGSDWKFYGSDINSMALMGCVSYPIDTDSLDGFDDLERELIRAGVAIKFKIGDVEIAASREALQYSDHTKKNIRIRVKAILAELEKVISAKFNGCGTLWEASCLLNKVDDFSSELYKLRNLFKDKMKWKGQKLSPNYGFHTSEDVRFTKYSSRWNQGKIKNQGNDSYCVANSHIIFVENDTNAQNSILNKLVPLVEDSKTTACPVKTIFLIHFKDAATKKAWQKNGFDAPIIQYSTLPHKVLTQYPDYTRSGSVAGSTAQITKHKVKEFKFKAAAPMRRYSNRSDWWESVSVDPETDSGVYLEIYGFEYKSANLQYAHPSFLNEVIKSLDEAKIPVPSVIYGFKKSLTANKVGEDSADKAKKNPNMVCLWEYIKNKLTETVKTKKLSQAWVDRAHFKEITNGIASNWYNRCNSNCAQIKSVDDSNGAYSSWMDAADKMQHTSVANVIDNIVTLCDKFNVKIDTNVKPSIDLKRLAINVEETYPLLSFVDVPYYSDKKAKISKLLTDYINGIDALKKSGV
ncbi:MAG: hypothetical protein FJY17_00195 [Bacteroidetes bacterium]|nr:hypothetical protein [Bacteroidota bacterium]